MRRNACSSSRIVVISSREDLEEPLAYLVGAGVGDIDLCVPGCDGAQLRSLCEKMRDLNPDSTVSYGSLAQVPDLVFALLGSAEVVQFAAAGSAQRRPRRGREARRARENRAAALASSVHSMCRRAVSSIHSASAANSAGFIAMLATTEVLKMLGGV